MSRFLSILSRALQEVVRAAGPTKTQRRTTGPTATHTQTVPPDSRAHPAGPADSRRPSRARGAAAKGGGAAGNANIGVYDLSGGLPQFSYEPQPDGHADPGEVVWTWVPYEEDPHQGKDRPVLVVARHGALLVVAQLTSQDHDRDAEQEAHWGRYWLDIGSGDWDRARRPSEVRLDRLLWVKPHAIRREGGTLPRPVFAKVVQALTELHR